MPLPSTPPQSHPTDPPRGSANSSPGSCPDDLETAAFTLFREGERGRQGKGEGGREGGRMGVVGWGKRASERGMDALQKKRMDAHGRDLRAPSACWRSSKARCSLSIGKLRRIITWGSVRAMRFMLLLSSYTHICRPPPLSFAAKFPPLQHRVYFL